MGLAGISVWVSQRGTSPGVVSWLNNMDRKCARAAAPTLDPGTALLIYGPSIAGTVGDKSEYVSEYVLFGLIAALVLTCDFR